MSRSGYTMYLCGRLMPVPPQKLELTINNKNETVDLLNGGEINLIKAPGLTDIKFDLLIPNVKYPFASYNHGFKRAFYYLEVFERLKTSKMKFNFILYRKLPDGTNLYHTAMKVTLEDYTQKEEAENGVDVVVSIELKQYVSYGAKKAKIVKGSNADSKKNKLIIEKESREKKNIKLPTTHTVSKTDTIWSIAKKYYGDELKYLPIRNANKSLLNSPEDLEPGMKLKIPKN